MVWIELITLAVLVWSSVVDWKTHEIPDAAPLALLVMGVALAFWVGGPQSDVQLWERGVGLALGLVGGALFFAVGAMGGGDVKLLSALGVLLGWKGLGWTLLGTAIAGGFLSAWALSRGRKETAYAPAIAGGYLAFVLWQGETLRTFQEWAQ